MPRHRLPPNLTISQIELEDVVSTAEVTVAALSLDATQSYFVAQVPVRANGVNMLALVDTGAGVTVASQSLLPLLGIFVLEPCRTPAAVGMAGIPVRFVGAATITFQLGHQSLDHLVHFTETDCTPRAADAYNIILDHLAKDIALLTEGSLLTEDHVMVAPAVSRAASPKLFLSNPTDTPKVIYKDQHLTTAHPVVELPNGSIVDLYQHF
ncbi:unnamed protein product [Haemonchus placei]|uniref:Peptidase A2 domain-containing protein n=1 Tax=Haemonchus placei TaxID=6290 RepID=A0A0N4WJI4_HAEPC|nr:unnamed protein product [Haemonchus placei]